jgi:hypothetical protein
LFQSRSQTLAAPAVIVIDRGVCEVGRRQPATDSRLEAADAQHAVELAERPDIVADHVHLACRERVDVAIDAANIATATRRQVE